jgi:hypothetical protein
MADHQEIQDLRAALEIERRAAEEERRKAQRWEREAVLRVSSVAGTLTAQVLAAHRLASSVERALLDGRLGSVSDVADAVRLFREVERRGARR